MEKRRFAQIHADEIITSFPQLFYPLMTRQFFAIFMKSLKTSVCHESLGRTFQA